MLFSFNWLPLGGFVRIKGEGDPSVPGGLAAASPWVRIAVYMAGPLANLILAVGMYAFMISQVGVPTQVRIAEVSPNSPAAEAGLLPGDLIVTANQQAISEMYELRTIIYDNLGQPIDVVYQRGDQIFDTTVVPRDPPPQDGAIGIMMENIVEPISWYGALPYGLAATGNHAMALITLPAEVIKGNIAPQLARPVGYKGMYDIYQEVREQEPVEGVPASFNLIGFFTTITISLGVLNLLPIPAMDGGRILFALPEIVLRRRIPIEWQNAINLISFTALILLFLYVNLLDFTNPVQLP
jgi:regulator of sigma E protease